MQEQLPSFFISIRLNVFPQFTHAGEASPKAPIFGSPDCRSAKTSPQE